MYSLFSIYNFKLNYPVNWRVKLSENASLLDGNVVFFDPEGKASICVTWGELEKAKEKYSSAKDHAQGSLSKMVNEKTTYKTIKVIAQDSIQVNNHKAYLNHIELSILKFGLIPLFPKSVLHSLISIFIHCEESQRFFVIIGDSHPNDYKDLEEKLHYALKSFNCHLPIETIEVLK
ncbi:MAG: hypothetical protein QXL69_03305 [Candidatus Bathyarchaeia archaeon]|nr:hypothetical protein [Candidatus Bathyarchaeota archaeon]